MAENKFQEATKKEATQRKEWKKILGALHDSRNSLPDDGGFVVTPGFGQDVECYLGKAYECEAAVKDIIAQMREYPVDQATKDTSLQFLVREYEILHGQLVDLNNWAATLRIQKENVQPMASVPSTQGSQLSVAGSKARSTSSRSSRRSTVSSTTRRKVEAAAKLKFIREQKQIDERRRAEDEERARRVEEEKLRAAEQEAERIKHDEERRLNQERQERERREVESRRRQEDEERRVLLELQTASNLELMENGEQEGGLEIEAIGGENNVGAWVQDLQATASPYVPVVSQPLGTFAAGPNTYTSSTWIATSAVPPMVMSSGLGPSNAPANGVLGMPTVGLAGPPAGDMRVQFASTEMPRPDSGSARSERSEVATLAELFMVGAPEIEKFRGDVGEFLPFVTAFETSIASKTADAGLKMAKLWQNLDESVRKYVANNRYDSVNGYAKSMKTLFDIYGHPAKITDKVLEKLTRKKTPIRADSHDELMELTVAIGSALETVETVQRRFAGEINYDYVSALDTREALLTILQRLPPYFQREFVGTLAGHPGDLRRLYGFLCDRTKSSAHPLLEALAKRGRTDRPAQQAGRPGVTSSAPHVKKVFTSHAESAGEVRQKQEVKFVAKNREVSDKECPACQETHELGVCQTFRELPRRKRWDLVRKSARCFNCFFRHLARECKEDSNCRDSSCEIRAKHHPLLHSVAWNNQDQTQKNEENKELVAEKQANSTNGGEARSGCFMSVAAVRIYHPVTGKSVTTFAMLDGCADVDVVTDEMAGILGLEVEEIGADELIHTVTGSKLVRPRVADIVVSPFGKPEMKTMLNGANVMPCTHFKLNKVPDRADKISWEKFEMITSSEMVDVPRVSLLISNIHKDIHVPAYVIELSEDRRGLYAVETKGGYCALHGHVGSGRTSVKSINHVAMAGERRAWHASRRPCLTQFLCPEDLSNVYDTRKMPSLNEDAAQRKMDEGLKFKHGHYEVPIPFVEDDVQLPDNYEQAARCLEGMRRRFRKDDKFFKEYSAAIGKYIEEGHAERVKEDEVDGHDGRRFFLLHHHVRHPKKKKMRVVFNLSKKFKGVSLNDKVIQCPDLLERLVGVLVRFRENPIAVTGDIKSFFHAITVPDEQADLMRFLWFEDNDVNGKIVQHRMKVQVFGGTGSQAAAVTGLQKAIRSGGVEWWTLEQIEKIIKSFYSDDYVGSFKTREEAAKIVREVVSVLRDHGFQLRGLASNDQRITEEVRDRNAEGDEDNGEGDTVLGIGWNRREDKLKFQFQKREPKGMRYTKRECLSLLMGLFDPLGLLVPFALPLKLLVHEMVIGGYGWDEEIPESLDEQVRKVLDSLSRVSELEIPRYSGEGIGEITGRELHVFSDGSTKSYGCSAYLRQVDGQGRVRVTLVSAKNRLCPSSVKLTVPRIELSAAVMAVRMAQELKQELNSRPDRVFYWTDSKTVLRYLRNKTKRFHVFVANRLAEIRHHSDPFMDWRYVQTKVNPADLTSRPLFLPVGEKARERLQLWYDGPEFLMGPRDGWPLQNLGDESDEVLDEDLEVITSGTVRQTVVHTAMKQPTVAHRGRDVRREVVEKLNNLVVRCSTTFKMKRCFAWLAVFIRWRVRDRRVGRPTPPSCADLEAAELDIARVVQRGQFMDEIYTVSKGRRLPRRNHLYRLNPQYDMHDRLLRVGTRLQHSDIPYNQKYPIILPKKGHLTELLIHEAHVSAGHQGSVSVLAKLRERWWVIGAKTSVNRVLYRCVPCRRYHARLGNQMMSQLPEDRVKVGGGAFESTSVDLFGPFMVKRARSLVKRYCALFTCNSTRAVHLEIVHYLSMDSFMQAFRRFVSRRGQIRVLRSDQATNFRAADREINDAIEEWNRNDIGKRLQQTGVEWRFNVPHASHHGGVHERLIRSVRESLRHVIEMQTLDDETLLTLVAEVEGIMNSRPLEPWSNDPNSAKALCPNDLLIARPTCGLPPGDFPEGLLKRKWRQCQQLVSRFWDRFYKDYLNLLSLRSKWLHRRRNICVGDLVLVSEPSQLRAQWPIARVVGVKVGEDGLVRSCRVKTATSEYDRPIVKIVLLEGCGDE